VGLDGGPARLGVTGIVGLGGSHPCYYLRMDADKQSMVGPMPADQVAMAVEVFRMLAAGTRIQILWALIDKEMSVNELAETIGKPGPSVSQHLAKLRMARLVRTKREGTSIFYQLENDHVRQLIIDGIFNAEHAGPSVPIHHQGARVTPVHPVEGTGRRSSGGAP
jgi:DNA-binding transcriptional ArsR family regulator